MITAGDQLPEYQLESASPTTICVLNDYPATSVVFTSPCGMVAGSADVVYAHIVGEARKRKANRYFNSSI